MTDKYQEKARGIVDEWYYSLENSATFDPISRAKLDTLISQALRAANDEKCEKCKQEQSVITFPSEFESHLNKLSAFHEQTIYADINCYDKGWRDCYYWLRSKVEGK